MPVIEAPSLPPDLFEVSLSFERWGLNWRVIKLYSKHAPTCDPESKRGLPISSTKLNYLIRRIMVGLKPAYSPF